MKFTSLLWLLAFIGLLALVFVIEHELSDSKISDTEVDSIKVIEPPEVMPGIYIDQTITPASAKNRRELYDDLLKVCQEEQVPLKQLTAKQRSQLGTMRLQRWIDGNITAYRLESWDYQLAEPQETPHCYFELISRGRHVLIEADGVTGIHLNDNQPYQLKPLSNIDASLLLRSPAREDVRSNDKMTMVAGQPCVNSSIASQDEVKTCTWAGGVEWGFEPRSQAIESVLTAPQYQLFRSIILKQTSADNSVDTIMTNQFVIGEPLDKKAFSPKTATALPAQNLQR